MTTRRLAAEFLVVTSILLGLSFVIIPAVRAVRWPAIISVAKSDAKSPEELSGLQQLKFNGFPAYERMVVEREYIFDDPAESRYTLFVNCDSDWFVIEYLVSEWHTKLPSTVRRFIETVRMPNLSEAL